MRFPTMWYVRSSLRKNVCVCLVFNNASTLVMSLCDVIELQNDCCQERSCTISFKILLIYDVKLENRILKEVVFK